MLVKLSKVGRLYRLYFLISKGVLVFEVLVFEVFVFEVLVFETPVSTVFDYVQALYITEDSRSVSENLQLDQNFVSINLITFSISSLN